jgi:Outer membrane protein beta-barrel domain/Thrombospondin type 3 repeat
MRAPRRVGFFKLVLLGLLILPTPALAAEPTAPATSATSATTSAGPMTVRETTDNDEPPEYRFEFGLTAGAHFFNKLSGLGRTKSDDEGLSPDTNIAFGGRLALNFNRWVSVEGEALLVPTHTRDNVTKIFAAAYRGSLNIHLVPSGPFRPFITLGYGAISTISNDTTYVPSDTDGMLHAGVGFKIGLGDHAGLRFDGRVVLPPAVFGSSIPVGNETGYDGPDWELLGGLYLNFGEVERSNKTIVTREVVNMLPPPPPDPDGDGIVGVNDKCPNIAEDKDGFEDEDGCPEADNDKDGIPDQQDKCPNKPETMNGIDDDDGCPEEDTDGDGIIGSTSAPTSPRPRTATRTRTVAPTRSPTP